MPAVGSDEQRGGWYDVVERVREPGEEATRFTWHDRKAWWQQEQAILAYQIMAGSTGDEEALRLGTEAAAFYNAFFFDYEEGSVYFNVLANGIPYLVGTERQKGSHSMAGYHSFELAYLATVYTNLLITKEPMDLWFSPIPGDLKDNILRVSPDILPPGSIRIGEVEVDGAAVRRLRRRRADGPGPRGQEAGQDPGPGRADDRSVRGHDQDRRRRGRDDPDRQARHEHLRHLPGRGRERPGQEAGAARAQAQEPRLDRQRRDPGAPVRPPADGHLGPRRHLRGGPNDAVREALQQADPDQEDINVVESYDPFRDPDGLGKKPD